MNRPPISVGFAAPKRNEQDRRLAQLRIAQQQTAHSSGNAGTKKEGEAVVHDWLHWLRERADARERVQADVPPQPQQGLRLSELPRRDSISQPKPVRAPVSQPASDTQDDIGRESEVERPRVQFVKSHWRYDIQKARCNVTARAFRAGCLRRFTLIGMKDDTHPEPAGDNGNDSGDHRERKRYVACPLWQNQ